MQQLTSYLSGAWVYGQGPSREIQHAVTGEPLYQVCSDGLPLAASRVMPASRVARRWQR
jgi:oxepin-CoA hydrolase/3-oxo-5,6-dehydrosuberyl-CoA semialdehyde dehydrogenase